jgi:hypothetical protein
MPYHHNGKYAEPPPNPRFLAMFGFKTLTASKKNPPNSSSKNLPTTSKMSSPTAEADTALARLQNSLAEEDAKKAGNS